MVTCYTTSNIIMMHDAEHINTLVVLMALKAKVQRVFFCSSTFLFRLTQGCLMYAIFLHRLPAPSASMAARNMMYVIMTIVACSVVISCRCTSASGICADG